MVTYLFLCVSTLHCSHYTCTSSSCKSKKNHNKAWLMVNTEGQKVQSLHFRRLVKWQ